MKRAPSADVATLAAALRWAETHWAQQPTVPLRIHVHEVNPSDLLGAPKMAPGFMAYMTMTGAEPVSVTGTQTCFHPNLPQERDGTLLGILCACTKPDCSRLHCPDCMGLGVRQMTEDRYAYPMRVALRWLRNTEPQWYATVVKLAANDWHLADIPEDRALRAIRKLHGRYSSAPMPRVTWTDKSESQRLAEAAA